MTSDPTSSPDTDGDFEMWKERTACLYLIVGIILLILGTFGNMMIVLVLHKKSEVSVFSMLLTALAITDLLHLYVLFIPQLIEVQFGKLIFKVSSSPCTVYIWLGNSLTMLSVWLLTATTIFRTLDIVLWTKLKREARPHTEAFLIISGCIILSVGVNAFSFYTTQFKNSTRCLLMDENKEYQAFDWVLLVLNSLVPSLVIIVCNCLLIRTVKKSTRKTSRYGQQNSAPSGNITSRLTLALIVTSLTFVVLTLPCHIMSIEMRRFHDNGEFNFWFHCAIMMCVTNSTVNFYLFLLTGTKFRGDVKRMLNIVFARCYSANHHDQSSSEEKDISDF